MHLLLLLNLLHFFPKQIWILRIINPFKSKFSTAEKIVDYLRKTYSEYSCKTNPPLLHLVQTLLLLLPTTMMKFFQKRRKIHESEPESKNEYESDVDEEGDERIQKERDGFKDLVEISVSKRDN